MQSKIPSFSLPFPGLSVRYAPKPAAPINKQSLDLLYFRGESSPRESSHGWPNILLQRVAPIPPFIQPPLSSEAQYYQLLTHQAISDLLWQLPSNKHSLSVGRSSQNDVAFKTDGYLSKQHLELSLQANQIYVMDKGSSNGTNHYRFNGKITPLANSSITKLQHGELLKAGNTIIRIFPQKTHPVNISLFPQHHSVGTYSQSLPYQEKPAIQLMTGDSVTLAREILPFQKAILLNHIENGIQLIQEGYYEAAIQHFNNAHVAEMSGFHLPTARLYGINSQNPLNSIAVQKAIVNQAMDCWFKPEEKALALACVENMIKNQDALPDSKRKNLNVILFHSALVQAEEWIHALQYVHMGPLCTKEAAMAKFQKLFYSEEEDAAVFLWLHGIDLPQEYRARYKRSAILKQLETTQRNQPKTVL